MYQTLREELRKVQSSAALLERTRSPGVGYWGASRTESTQDVRTSMSATDLSSQNGSSRSGSPAPGVNEEEVNLEYLRNVILQFLEHKEMRVCLVLYLAYMLNLISDASSRISCEFYRPCCASRHKRRGDSLRKYDVYAALYDLEHGHCIIFLCICLCYYAQCCSSPQKADAAACNQG